MREGKLTVFSINKRGSVADEADVDYAILLAHFLQRLLGGPRTYVDKVIGDFVSALVEHIDHVDVFICKNG